MKAFTTFVLALLLVPGCRDDKKSGPVADPATSDPTARETKDFNTDMLATVPSSVLAGEVIAFHPTDGHHFETKAPQKCADFEPKKKTPREIACQLPEPGTHRIELNVCDDGKNYCKPVKFDLEAKAPKGYVPDADAARRVLAPPAHEHPQVEGFLINEPDDALATAKQDGKLLFVHFYGIWCPPCNMLEEHVYGEKAFLDATDGMVRVMLDADSDLSWEWKSKFKVGGYPTVLVADSQLREIDRLVGYRPLGEVVNWAERAVANRDTPVASLVAKHPTPADAPADVRKRVGLWHFERADWEDATKWLADHPDPEARKTELLAQMRLAGDAENDEAKIAALEKLVTRFPDDVQYARWVGKLLDAKPAEAKTLVPKALENLEKWSESDELAATGYSRADLAWLAADLHDATGDEEAAKAAYLRAAELYGEMAKSSKLDVARGANMERAYALHKAGENEKAAELYTQLADAYPEEFSFNYDFAYVLNELKEFEKAHEYATRAQKHSYGDNWLRASHLRAKIEKAMGKEKVACETAEKGLAEAAVPRTTDVRTHRYLGRLRDFVSECESVE